MAHPCQQGQDVVVPSNKFLFDFVCKQSLICLSLNRYHVPNDGRDCLS